MAANKEVLKEFLVALGFQVNAGGLRMFMGTLLDTSTAAGKTTAALGGLAAAAEEVTRTVAGRLEKMYYASKRTGEAAKNMEPLEYGFERIGLQAENARALVEMLGKTNLARNPGLLGLLKNFGVDTDKGAVESFHQLLDVLARMDPVRAAGFARMFNISPEELTMLVQSKDALWSAVEAKKKLNEAMGVDFDKQTEDGKNYTNAMRDLGSALDAVKLKVGMEMLDGIKMLTEYLRETAIPAISTIAKKIRDVASAAGEVYATGRFTKHADTVARGSSRGPSMYDRANAANRDAYRKQQDVTADHGQAMPGAGGKTPAPQTPASAATMFAALEKQYGLPPGLLGSIRGAESNGNDKAVSRRGAQGPFQLMPGTSKDYGVSDPFDLRQAASGAARMLHDLLAHYNGDLMKAVAAYNWGSGNIDKYGLGAAPAETRAYVPKVVAGMGGQAPQVHTTVTVHGAGDAKVVADEVLRRNQEAMTTAMRLSLARAN